MSSTIFSFIRLHSSQILCNFVAANKQNRKVYVQDAPIRSVLNVQMSGPEAIAWPDLDVDLEIDSLRHPERYPLVIKRNALDFVAQ